MTKVLSDHMVAGSLSALDLKQQIKAGNRQRKTASGGTLTVTMQGKNIVLRDDGVAVNREHP